MRQGISGIANAGLIPVATILQTYGNRGQELGILKDEENFLNHSANKILDVSDYLEDNTTYNNEVNARLDNDTVRTASTVGNTIGNMIPAIASNIAVPGSGLVVTGLSSGGNSARETINYNRDNLEQATRTGIAKGAVEAGTEKLTGGNILSKGSLDDIVNKTIGKKIKSKIGKEIANKGYQFLGEMAEEQISDNLGYVIDKLVNNKELPDFKEWWNNVGETNRMTFLTTLTMNMIGLGGGNYVDQEANKYFREAQKIIDQENLKDSASGKQNIVNNQNTQRNLPQKQTNNENILSTKQLVQENAKLSQNGNMERIKVNDEKAIYVDEQGNENDIYFRFDNKNEFRGKEHESGVSMWEERIDEELTPNYEQYGDEISLEEMEEADAKVDEILNKYGTTYEEYDSMPYSEQLKIKREIAKDKGLITHGASVFDLTNEGINFFKKYDEDHHETNYLELNFFTGTKNGQGIDGENVVIPNEEILKIDTKDFLDIIDDIEYDEKFENSTTTEKNTELMNRIKILVENTRETLYNNNESESDINGRETTRTRNQRLLEQRNDTSIQQNSQYSKKTYNKQEYSQWEQSIKPIDETNITSEQRTIRDNIKRQYNKDIVFFNGENAAYYGGASLTDPSNIYVNINTVNEFGLNRVALHETLESDILHNQTLKEEIIIPTIKKIIQDHKFQEQKNIFWKNQDGDIPSDYAIAKDIIADRFAEVKSGESLDYRNVLSQETNMTMDFAIENFEKQISRNNIPLADKYTKQTSKNVNGTKKSSNTDDFSNTSRYIESNLNIPTKEYFDNQAMQALLTDEDLKVINKIYEKENKTQILTEKRKAKILEKYASTKYSFKDSADTIAQKWVNKGHYVDQLADRTKNQELKFAYDRNLNSFAEGQYVIGVAQTDNQGKIIGKSINDLWKPAEEANKTGKFAEYLLHLLNIDRSERKKYVFGEEIGPAESTKIALNLEQENPKFKIWAKDIKDFNHNNLNNLKEAGIITQENIDYLESMYPNYVPILRDVDNGTYEGGKEKTGVSSAIKKAIGGNADIQPLKDAMSEQAIRFKRLINQNRLGIELAKSLNTDINNTGISFTPGALLGMDTFVEADSSGKKYYTYFENGELQKLEINDNLYESLKPTEISKIEKTLPFKGLQKLTNINRSLLTTNNPLFVVTNFFKDLQDGMFNSKYSSKFIKNYGKALNEIITKGNYYQSYMANRRNDK